MFKNEAEVGQFLTLSDETEPNNQEFLCNIFSIWTEVRKSSADSDLLMLTETVEKYLCDAFSCMDLAVI